MTVSTRYKMLGLAAAGALIIAAGSSWATPPSKGPHVKRPHTSTVNINGPKTRINGPKINGPRTHIGGPKIHGPNTFINGPKIHGPNTTINGPKIGGVKTIINGPKIDGPKVNINGPKIGAPKISINGPKITGPTIVDASAFAAASASASASTTVIAAGGGFFSPAPASVTSIAGLNVDGAEEIYYEEVTEKVPVTREACIEKLELIETVRPIQAVCWDDKKRPHPASQVSGEQNIDAHFEGEIYRCVAGTHMVVTMGQMIDGEVNWDQGQSFSCRKGEALVHKTGGGLTCAAQKPMRDCNERSLLRRHKTGIKMVRATQEYKTCEKTHQTVYEVRTHQVQKKKKVAIGGSLVLDGGVGQNVF